VLENWDFIEINLFEEAIRKYKRFKSEPDKKAGKLIPPSHPA
jgi:hypothetical protein